MMSVEASESFFIFFICLVGLVNSSCHFSNSTLFNLNTNFKYTTELIDNEFIIVYDGFYSQGVRHELLRDILALNNITEFEVADKNQIFNEFPSDFDVFRNKFTKNVNLSQIEAHPKVKSVSAQRKVTRSLQNSEEDEEREEFAPVLLKKRQLFKALPQKQQIVDQINAKFMWDRGYTGAGVNVAVFDTGLEKDHPHFKNVIERIDWTDEKNADDRIGHGTFVCGLIASQRECLGIAPDANLFIFKVFKNNQVSYTSWFLDAFNYAILKRIDVLNLSIGGPDFMDVPFINKVWEVTSNNIVMVSGIGNDGPLYGTLNNPADQLDVIGVGGINSDDQIARFSSRGMTTWELPSGYGRVKPDVVTYCTHVRGSKRKNGCRTLSGTSVASPIVSGAIALLVSIFKKHNMEYRANPANVKQAIMAGAERLPNSNMFEQGFGKLNLIESYQIMMRYKPQASLIPSYLDLTECPYFWPYCSQPLYHTGMPIIANVTILNALGSSGRISQKPKWHPSTEENGDFLKMSFEYSSRLWPWSGYLALRISVSEKAKNFEGVVKGFVSLAIESPDSSADSSAVTSELSLFIKAKIIPTPSRKRRLLWDQFHNLHYPAGYFPRDDLRMKNDPLDWNADHLHTNFREMYQYLRSAGYFVEVLGTNYNCFDANNYGALMIVDSEDEFHKSEVRKIYEDVKEKGLSVIVFADWYNASVIKAAKFYDENTRKWWTPLTGGANIPALNELLEPFGIELGDRVFEGEYRIGEHSAYYASGTSINKFPKSSESFLIYRELNDQGEEFLSDVSNSSKSRSIKELVPILGLHQVPSKDKDSSTPGRLSVYGDSNCLDSSHMKTDCFWLLSALIEYSCYGNVYRLFRETNSLETKKGNAPVRVLIDDPGARKNLKQGESMFNCEPVFYERDFPIEKIPQHILPDKTNTFNFLQLGKKEFKEFKEFSTNENVHRAEYLESTSLPSASFLNRVVFVLFDNSFPFVTSLAVFLVLCFFVFKIWKYKKRIRLKRSFAKFNFNRNKLNK